MGEQSETLRQLRMGAVLQRGAAVRLEQQLHEHYEEQLSAHALEGGEGVHLSGGRAAAALRSFGAAIGLDDSSRLLAEQLQALAQSLSSRSHSVRACTWRSSVSMHTRS